MATAPENTTAPNVSALAADTAKLNIQAESSENAPHANGTTEADHASVSEGRRLYLGNVAYAATEELLTEFFKGFEVKSVSIPKYPHTGKPVGYAFVDLATADEAQRAIAELNRKPILERKVSVQLARMPQENGEGNTAPRRRNTGRNGRLRRRGQKPGEKEETAAPAKADAAPGESDATTGEAVASATEDAKSVKKPRSPKRKTHKGPPENGIESKVKVMVTNLPYDLTEERLKQLFTDYKPVSAKVALRPIPPYMIKKLHARGEARKGRGFGFVTLESEEMQKKAITEMNLKEVEGRLIEVKVAIDSPDKTDEGAEKPEAAPSATEAVTAAAATTAAEATTPVAATA